MNDIETPLELGIETMTKPKKIFPIIILFFTIIGKGLAVFIKLIFSIFKGFYLQMYGDLYKDKTKKKKKRKKRGKKK